MCLFVDCDNTLVIWEWRPVEGTSLVRAESCRANEPLIAAVRAWRAAHPDALVIVWSGGGMQYAAHWAARCLPGLYDLALSKDVTMPQDGDVCVDDEAIAVAGRRLTPDEFIEECREAGADMEERDV